MGGSVTLPRFSSPIKSDFFFVLGFVEPGYCYYYYIFFQHQQDTLLFTLLY